MIKSQVCAYPKLLSSPQDRVEAIILPLSLLSFYVLDLSFTGIGLADFYWKQKIRKRRKFLNRRRIDVGLETQFSGFFIQLK